MYLTAKFYYFVTHGIYDFWKPVCTNMRMCVCKDFFVCSKLIKNTKYAAYVAALV